MSPTRCLAAALAATVVLLTGAGATGAVAATDGDVVVDLGGTPTPSTSTDPAAPAPLEAGLWADLLRPAAGEAPHQVVYRRTMADSQVHVGVVGAPASTDVETLELATYAPDGTDCGTATTTSTYGSRDPFGASVVVGAAEPGERGTPCQETAEVRIAVGRGTSPTTEDVPVALRIVEEAPASGAAGDDGLAGTDLPTARPPETGPARPATGTASFLDAPVLADGTWSDTVDTGAVRLYRVRLERGQSLAAGVEVPRQDRAAREALGEYVEPRVDLAFADPTRTVVADVLVDAVSSTPYAGPDGDRETLVDGLPAVSWLAGFDSEVASLPGDYWVVLSVAEVADVDPVPVPVELTVETRDESEVDASDEPAYPEVVTGPGGTAGPPGYAAATPFLVGPGEFAAAVPADAAAPAGGTGASGRPVVRTAGGAALGVVGLVCLAGGAVLLRRRVSAP